VSEFTERDGDHFAKLARRRKRRERARISIDRILDAQPFHERKWFRLSELVNHCAKIPGMLLSDSSRKEEAFEIFRASIYRGDFGGSVGRPTRIRWITDEPSAPRWLPRDSAAPNGLLFSSIVELLISRADAAAWFLGHGVFLPHWLAETHDERQVSEQQVWPSSETSGMPPGYDEPISEKCFKPASLEGIKDAICAVYNEAKKSGAKPPNIKELPPLVQDLLATSGHTASGRQIQEVGSAFEFKQHRRTPGKTVKSERPRG
jgi:hypothetical protein